MGPLIYGLTLIGVLLLVDLIYYGITGHDPFMPPKGKNREGKNRER